MRQIQFYCSTRPLRQYALWQSRKMKDPEKSLFEDLLAEQRKIVALLQTKKKDFGTSSQRYPPFCPASLLQ